MSNSGKKFKLPLISRELKEVDKNEDTTPNIKYYFKSFGRRFSKMISINLMMLFTIIPIAAAIFAYFLLMPRMFVFTDTMFPALNGINMISDSPTVDVLLNIVGTSMDVTTVSMGLGTIIIAICALFLFITFGWQNLASTYLARELYRGRSLFVFSDYFYSIKKNLKQGFIMGAIDFIVSAVLIFDFIYFYNQPADLVSNLMFWGICGVSVIYIWMRFYIYLLLVTFDLPIKKIFKNALIFTALGIKRNIVASLWILIVGGFNIALGLALLPANFVMILILPFFYLLGFAQYTIVYAAYPTVNKYMIEPYYDEYGNPRSEENKTVTE